MKNYLDASPEFTAGLIALVNIAEELEELTGIRSIQIQSNTQLGSEPIEMPFTGTLNSKPRRLPQTVSGKVYVEERKDEPPVVKRIDVIIGKATEEVITLQKRAEDNAEQYPAKRDEVWITILWLEDVNLYIHKTLTHTKGQLIQHYRKCCCCEKYKQEKGTYTHL